MLHRLSPFVLGAGVLLGLGTHADASGALDRARRLYTVDVEGTAVTVHMETAALEACGIEPAELDPLWIPTQPLPDSSQNLFRRGGLEDGAPGEVELQNFLVVVVPGRVDPIGPVRHWLASPVALVDGRVSQLLLGDTAAAEPDIAPVLARDLQAPTGDRLAGDVLETFERCGLRWFCNPRGTLGCLDCFEKVFVVSVREPRVVAVFETSRSGTASTLVTTTGQGPAFYPAQDADVGLLIIPQQSSETPGAHVQSRVVVVTPEGIRASGLMDCADGGAIAPDGSTIALLTRGADQVISAVSLYNGNDLAFLSTVAVHATTYRRPAGGWFDWTPDRFVLGREGSFDLCTIEHGQLHRSSRAAPAESALGPGGPGPTSIAPDGSYAVFWRKRDGEHLLRTGPKVWEDLGPIGNAEFTPHLAGGHPVLVVHSASSPTAQRKQLTAYLLD